MQIKTQNTITFGIEVYQQPGTGKWFGIVLDGNEEAVAYADGRSTKMGAIRAARREFFKALSCSHDMEWREYGWISQDFMGNDLYGHEGKCKKCGFVDRFEIESV